MDIKGTYTFQAPIELVWKTLLDPDILARSLPGIENMKITGPDSYEATMTVGLAAVKGVYTGTVAVLDKQEPNHYRLQAEGSSTRGFIKAEGTVDLAQQNGNTIASYAGTAQLGGPIAGVGMRMLSGAAKVLINQFFGSIAEELRAQLEPAPAPQAVASATPASAGQPASAGVPTGAAPRAGARKAAAIAPTQPDIAQRVITRPPSQPLSPLIPVVRALKLSDGSAEDEQRWAERLVLGGIGVLLGVFLLGFLFGRGSRGRS